MLITWSYGLATAGYALVLGILLGQRTPEAGFSRRPGRLMLFAIQVSLAWSALVLAYTLWEVPLFYSMALVADQLRYGAWFLFLLVLLGPGGKRDDRGQPVVGFWAVLAALVVLSGVLAVVLSITAGDGGARWSRLILYQWPVLAIVGLFLLEQLFRNATADSRWHIKPLCLGLAAVFLFDLYLFSDALLFGQLAAEAAGIRGFVHALIVPLLILSIARSRDWVRKVRLSQTMVVHTTTLLVTGVYLLTMAGVGYYVRFSGGEWGRALQQAVVFSALLGLAVVGFSRAMRARLRVLIGKHFFRYQYDYREEWLKFTRILAAQNSPGAMGEQIVKGLADMVESPAGCLWLREGAGQGYRQFSRWNMPEIATRELPDASLPQFLMERGWVVHLDEYREVPDRYRGLSLPGWLSELAPAWLVVPLLVGRELIGFVVLSHSRTQLQANWEVYDLLRTAGSQAAGFLAQMLATEALLEARKFESFNRMSAFVVHDLKNIVAQLSLMIRNAERHRDKPEFQQDMLMTVEHSVERMRQLMLQLREGAAPAGARCGVDLNLLLVRIREKKHLAGNFLEYAETAGVMVRGDAERLERVFGHLIQNAFDACEGGGRVWVKLERDGGRARIEVGDTGCGMAMEFVRERLSKPFQTTKPSGMGIGAYESFQYVRELGGEIAVDSEPGRGTRISVSLPVFDFGGEGDLMHEDNR